VVCSGDQNKEAPHAFTNLLLHYNVSGLRQHPDQTIAVDLRKDIQLS
jgi:hypothetical protein